MFCVQIRQIVNWLGMFGCALVSIQRIALSVAIVSMTTKSIVHYQSDYGNSSVLINEPMGNISQRGLLVSIEAEFDWSETLQVSLQFVLTFERFSNLISHFAIRVSS